MSYPDWLIPHDFEPLGLQNLGRASNVVRIDLSTRRGSLIHFSLVSRENMGVNICKNSHPTPKWLGRSLLNANVFLNFMLFSSVNH